MWHKRPTSSTVLPNLLFPFSDFREIPRNNTVLDNNLPRDRNHSFFTFHLLVRNPVKSKMTLDRKYVLRKVGHRIILEWKIGPVPPMSEFRPKTRDPNGGREAF
jgi:hypothetical protein